MPPKRRLDIVYEKPPLLDRDSLMKLMVVLDYGGSIGEQHAEKVWKNVGKNHTRNGWRRCKTTLETSGEDVHSHSSRVEKI